MNKNTILIATLIAFAISITPTFALNLTECSILNATNGIYEFSGNISTSEYVNLCINVRANNITLNCNGYYLYDEYNSEIAIFVNNSNNFTISNCNIYGYFGNGIQIGNSNYTIISDNNISSISKDIFCNALIGDYPCSDGTIKNNLLTSSSESAEGYFLNFDIYNNYFGQFFYFTKIWNIDFNNKFNTTRQEGIRIVSEGIEISGNFYSDAFGTNNSFDCPDADTDGFCDIALEFYWFNGETEEDELVGIDYLPLSDEYSVPETPTIKICEIDGSSLIALGSGLVILFLLFGIIGKFTDVNLKENENLIFMIFISFVILMILLSVIPCI